VGKRGWRAEVKRYAAPVAFLAAVTIAVLLVRSALEDNSSPAPSTVVTTRTTTPTTSTTTRRRRPKYYRLRAGETLSDVALRFDTTVEDLLKLNPKIEPTRLTVGQRIRVR
jgi:N-acetylmuramoyl-L-alanine amidase